VTVVGVLVRSAPAIAAGVVSDVVHWEPFHRHTVNWLYCPGGVDGSDPVAQIAPPGMTVTAMDGLEATRRIISEFDAVKVLILTTFDLDEYVYAALEAGASGFLLKDVPPEQLVAGIQIVADGQSLLAPAVATRLIATFRKRRILRPVPAGMDLLTPREREIFDLLARGLSNPEISRQLVLSSATVKTHFTRILSKLGMADRIQAVVLAYETGLIQPGDDAAPE
jgi:DNA-binding NarL/FixJ family response regulator